MRSLIAVAALLLLFCVIQMVFYGERIEAESLEIQPIWTNWIGKQSKATAVAGQRYLVVDCQWKSDLAVKVRAPNAGTGVLYGRFRLHRTSIDGRLWEITSTCKGLQSWE